MDTLSLSSSAFRDAATCLKKFEYRWKDQLVPAPKDQPPSLRRGLWLHRTLELADLGLDWRDELVRMRDWAIEHQVLADKAHQLAEEVTDLTWGYLRYWREQNQDWTLVGTEVPLEFEPAPGVKLSATVDCLRRDKSGRLWIWERKCLAEIPDSDWRCVDPQTMLQLVLLKTREPVQGVVFDYVWSKSPPKLRVRKDGRLFAGDDQKQTTWLRLAEAAEEIKANWTPTIDWPSPEAYVEWLYARVTNDGLWFQRYPTIRSDEHLIENMQDVADTVRAIATASRTGHYRRAWHPLTCPLFCPYMRLCANEFQLGRRNEMMRTESFVPATQEMWDQGRGENNAVTDSAA